MLYKSNKVIYKAVLSPDVEIQENLLSLILIKSFKKASLLELYGLIYSSKIISKIISNLLSSKLYISIIGYSYM